MQVDRVCIVFVGVENIEGVFMKILYGEDNPGFRAIMVRLLCNHGHEVVPTEDGQELLEVLCRNPGMFRVIITDQQMPRMTGIQVLRAVKESELHGFLPVIVQSDMTDPSFIEEVQMIGGIFVDKISFPILFSALAEIATLAKTL